MELGTELDSLHCKAVVHEYLRCKDSFTLFEAAATNLILNGHTRKMSYRAYNAYSSFILHLYEFILALFAREFGVTVLADAHEIKAALRPGMKTHDVVDGLINAELDRVIRNRIDAIERGYAPAYENDVQCYQALLPVPHTFAQTFRRTRNKVAGHVSYERMEKVSLTAFYEENHHYLYLLYRDWGDWWGRSAKEIPDLAEVTDFLRVLTLLPPSTNSESGDDEVMNTQ